MNEPAACRVLVLVAHPDDAEISAGGLLVRHCQRGSEVRIVSVTDGRGGHHEIPPDEIAAIRKVEARRAGERIGAECRVWDFPDGSLQPTLEVREHIIREIRQFRPDLVLTHRVNDYHPDHRAVGMAVQDASYMVTVPHVCHETPALRNDPVVAFMGDLFTRPYKLVPHVVLDITAEFDLAVQMTACHESQVFQWLPYHDGVLDTVPEDAAGRFEWLSVWLAKLHAARREHFSAELVELGVALDDSLRVECYEVSEYARELSMEDRGRLFPGCL